MSGDRVYTQRELVEYGIHEISRSHPPQCNNGVCIMAAVADAARRYLELTAEDQIGIYASGQPAEWPGGEVEP